MEHKFYTDDFERLLKEKSDEFRMYPSKRVWHSIYNNLHPDRKWPSITVTLLLVTVLFLIGYMNSNDKTASEKLIAGIKQPQANTVTSQNFTQLPANSITTVATSTQSTASYSDVTNSSKQTISSSLHIVDNSLQTNHSKNWIPVTTAAKNKTTVVTTNASFNTTAKKQLTDTTTTYNKESNKQQSNITGTEISLSASEYTVFNKPETNTAIVKQSQPNNAALINNTKIEKTESSNEALKITDINAANNNTPAITLSSNENKQALTATANAQKAGVNTNQLSAQDKSWIEDYALYNKTQRKKWKGRLNSEIYITPGVSMRSFYNNSPYKNAAAPASVNPPGTASKIPFYNPGFTFQAGAGIAYAASKNIRLKAGLQASFTSYSIPVTDIHHPVLTTLTFNNINSGLPYLEGRTSTIANVPGHNNKKIHNQTSQISVPIGLAIKLAATKKFEWYAGTSVQPTVVVGGRAYLLSSDNNNYVSDPSLLSKWNVNGTAETYIHYKMNGFILQAGPEFRYQFMSTYLKNYANTEKLSTIGVKIGIVKNL